MRFDPFGWWQPVRDGASALYAIRMAGLAVLVMAANSGVLCLVLLVGPEGRGGLAVFAGAVAVGLTLVAFRLRAGRAGWLPFGLVLFGGFLAASVALAVPEWGRADLSLADHGQRLAGWIVLAICAVLAVNGLAGWRWLRLHRVAMTF